MTTATPEHAAEHWPCPVGRITTPTRGNCIAEHCPVWRWVPLPADAPDFKAAVSAKQKEIGKGPGGHKEAVAYVMANRADLGLPTKPEVGFCGLGGRVLA